MDSLFQLDLAAALRSRTCYFHSRPRAIFCGEVLRAVGPVLADLKGLGYRAAIGLYHS